jgi:hypothetical protein
MRERDLLEDQDLGGWIILRWSLERLDGGVDQIGLDQNTNKWRALVNAVMNLWVPWLHNW